MEAQEKIRQQFDSVEKTFTREEAQVLRDGNDVIIRLVGLTFDVGKSNIKPEHFGLLTKVQNAINTFPECNISVEGHTDSHGSDALNLRLSQERADAVKAYLLANMSIDPSRMEAVGYGESKPIANNETAEGRAKNRRIDIVIHPQLLGMNE
jgi:outer membrane protein OmpA-like peptidoglycan-associated protein